jgi:cytoskeleton protein RodZ
MEHIPENNTEQGNRSASTTPTSLGGMLREARERLGLSVADVAAQIKFAPRQIEALEADDFKHLPEVAFLRGFVRSYAKILHLDAQTLLAVMPQTKAAVAELIPPSVEVPFPIAYSPQKQNLILLGAALLLAVVVVGFAVWHFTTPVKQAKVAKIETPISLPTEIQVAPAQPAPEPIPVPVPAPAPAPAQKQNVTTPSIPSESKKRPSVTGEQSAVGKTKTESAQPVEKIKPEAKIKPVTQIKPTEPSTQHDTSTQITTIRLVFDEESWTEIQDKDGKILSSQVNPKGSELTLKGHLPLSLVIGHAATTRLYQDGEPVDLSSYVSFTNDVARLTLE